MRKWEDIVRDKMEEPEGELPESVFAEFRARRDATAPAPKRFQPLWLLAPAMAAALAIVLILQKPAISEKDSHIAPQEPALVADASVSEDSEEPSQDAAPAYSPRPAQAVRPVATANQAQSSPLVAQATPVAPKTARQASALPQQAATSESAAAEAPAETAATPTETAPSSGQSATSGKGATSQVTETTAPEPPAASPFVPEKAKARRSVGRIVIPTAGVLAGGGLLAAAVPLLFGVRDNMEVPPGPVIGDNHTQQDIPEDKPTGNVHHYFPLRLGMSARFPVGEKLSVTTGLDYSGYKSAIDYTLSADKTYTAHYLGIPVRLDWTFASTKRLDFYLGGGLEVDWCLGITPAGDPVASDGFCASLLGAGGIQLNISKRLGLYVEPQLSWAFTPDYLDLKTYRNVHPLMFSVTSGLRFTIGN